MKLAALFLALTLTLGSAGANVQTAKSENVLLSRGIEVLSAASPMAVSCVGDEMYFSDEVFCRALNLSGIKNITITETPSDDEGALYVGSNALSAGTRINAQNLALMSFGASGDSGKVKKSHFCFRYDDEPYEMRCDIYLLDRENSAPTLSRSALAGMVMRTYESVSNIGYLFANDPDGDRIKFEISSPPKHGSIIFTDAAKGEYVYTPQKGYVGDDKFSYVAVDMYGNYSRAAEVKINVKNIDGEYVFSDMEGSYLHSFAISACASGLMSGKRIGELNCFEPDKEMTRSDFVVTALCAAGVKDIPECDKTVFYDDEKISPDAKKYVSYACGKGYLTGEYDKDGNFIFDPDEKLSCAEAAYILCGILGLERGTLDLLPYDTGSVPAWAEDAVVTLYSLGIMPDGLMSGKTPLTRIEAAYMFSKMADISK